MERFDLPDELAQEVCARLGVRRPTSIADVAELYRAWCRLVPFDTISKALALREGSVPPGADPVEFADQWLRTGLGGTCWGHTSTMAAVLERSGIRCRVGLDRFAVDDRVDLHSLLVVEDGDRLLALDVIHCSGDPLELRAGERGTHPAYPVALREDEGRLLHEYVRVTSDAREVGTYALLSTDLDAGDLRTFCEIARVYGMRAKNLYQRRFTATEMLDVAPTDDGAALELRTMTADGETRRTITDAEEAFAELGYLPAALTAACRAGLVAHRPDGTWSYTPRQPH